MELCNALNEYLMQTSFSVSHSGTHTKYRCMCVYVCVCVREIDSVSHTQAQTHTHSLIILSLYINWDSSLPTSQGLRDVNRWTLRRLTSNALQPAVSSEY